MILPKCAICETEINNENDSKEHLIPNAIGGRRKISGFICEACNKSTGNRWDAKLVKRLNSLCLLWGISRQRGEVPSQSFKTTAGEKIIFDNDGRMTFEKPTCSVVPLDSGNKLKINISASSHSTVKEMFKGIKKKYPEFNFDALPKNITLQEHYLSGKLPVDLSIGGHPENRSIVKSVLAWAVSSGVPVELCVEANNYLKRENSEPCLGFFYDFDLIKNRPEGVPLHCISIKGCHKTKQLIGYIEYFGFYRYVLCLSDFYEGKDMSNTYALNPITGEEIKLDIELNLTNSEIRKAYNLENIPMQLFQKALTSYAYQIQMNLYEKERIRVIDDALKYALKNCGAKESDFLTIEYANKITELVMEKIKPYFFRQ